MDRRIRNTEAINSPSRRKFVTAPEKSISLENMKYIFVLILLFVSQIAHSQVILENLRQKQEKKEASRWTLAGWLAQKERIQMMDYWLAMNTKDDPFEFSIGADSGDLDQSRSQGTSTSESSEDSLQYNFTAYASIIGIEGRWIDNEEAYEGSDISLHLRLLGASQQNTNINLEVGQYVRTLDIFTFQDEEFKTTFYGGSLTLYLIKYFGIKGRYYQIQEDTSDNQVEISGSRTEFEAFIDYSFVRVYGQLYQEEMDFSLTGNNPIALEVDGVNAGLKIFF
tara:strand:- start:7507 stop:8349 length:843 start_codon:yes stop_codon:yes gene_type:complete